MRLGLSIIIEDLRIGDPLRESVWVYLFADAH